MAEYARYLIDAGHEVDIITSKPGRARVVRQGNLTIYYDRRISHPLLTRYWPWFRFYSFSLTALPRLLQRSYDVIHMWLYTYGAPVRLVRQTRGTPYLYQLMGDYQIAPGRLHQRFVEHVVCPADRVAALTPRMAAQAAADLHVPVDVLPPWVDTTRFVPGAGRDVQRPQVLFASDVNTVQKGAILLLMAWNTIHRRCPEARLVFAGSFGQSGLWTGDAVGAVAAVVHDASARAAIEFLGEGRVEDLPRRYAQSAVTVLPSIGEAFGLVLVESLACGTPVVGNAFDGPGEIITDPGVGTTVPLRGKETLNDPACAEQLAEAVLTTLELAQRPETSRHCRQHAMQWSRNAIGPQLEQLYREMLSVHPRPSKQAIA